jgi:16S rRNA (cytidine1402-2'-O)-methyltransferase
MADAPEKRREAAQRRTSEEPGHAPAAHGTLQHSTRQQNERMAPRTLYVVATPIGNLEDVTLRALKVLKGVDLIACEDTRQTQKLLNHFMIATRTVSYHEHNERERAAELVEQIAGGASIALVTDAGTPAISDPGYHLVRQAIEHGIQVVPIPGAAAFVTALIASGLPVSEFEFRAFLPVKSGQRRELFASVREVRTTQVFYEAPHRIVEAMEDLVEILGPQRPVVVARELTKIHEEFLRGTAEHVLNELKSRPEVKGEIVLLIGRAEGEATPVAPKQTIAQRVRELMKAESLDEKDALKRAAKERGIGKSEAYREYQRTKR